MLVSTFILSPVKGYCGAENKRAGERSSTMSGLGSKGLSWGPPILVRPFLYVFARGSQTPTDQAEDETQSSVRYYDI